MKVFQLLALAVLMIGFVAPQVNATPATVPTEQGPGDKCPKCNKEECACPKGEKSCEKSGEKKCCKKKSKKKSCCKKGEGAKSCEKSEKTEEAAE